MSNQKECKYKEIKDYKTAFECFKQRFLIQKKSIFNLENDTEKVLTENSVQYLIDNFVENGYGGDASFVDKIKYQLITAPKKTSDDDEIKNKAFEILATAYWLWRLVPANGKMNTTREGVLEIIKLNNPQVKLDLEENKFFNEKIKGFASVGTYYNTNKPFELAYLIKLFLECAKENDENNDSFIKALQKIKFDKSDSQKGLIGYMQITSATDNNKKALSLNQGNEKASTSEKTPEILEHVKSVSVYNALLHFFDPEKYEAIVSGDHKSRILKAFEHKIKDKFKDKFKESDTDSKLLSIKTSLKEELNYDEDKNFTFYDNEIREMWDPSILPAKNVIYYGAPGTGKTYSLKKLVEAKIKAQSTNNENLTDYYEIVQFHPSYGYEDFIDGIKPTGISENGNIKLELKNGIFKEMCIKAFENLQEAKIDKSKLKNYYFIADEINRAELSRVFGELLLCIEEDKRLGFDDDGNLKEMNLIKTQNYSLWEEKHAVVKLDLHNTEDNGYRFGVPENIYFLATMNDIDKSIDSFDLALRRRFKWVHKGCDYDVIYNYLIDEKEVEIEENTLLQYVTSNKEKKGRCNILNHYISNQLNLGESYEIGHSYFMNIKVHGGKISQSACENLFELELAPLISEYLRAEIQDPKELKIELKKMKNIFAGK